MAGLLGAFGGSRGGAQAGAVGGTASARCRRSEATGVWVIGMRYKIINAETTEQVAQGYTEEKMEVGATSTSVLGVSQVAAGRRVARHDGAAPGAEVGLGNRQQVQVSGGDREIATPARAGVAVFGARRGPERNRERRMAEMSSLGKYEIRRELGRGAMGVVYEGFDPLIKRIVALKTIRADQLDGDSAETAIARFRREAQAAGGSTIRTSSSIYDFGEDAGVWYIAMEFVKGRELKDCFEANERFATADIVRIMTQILDALDYSHQQGVVHRDIKPANIFLLTDGTVKVADFGIAHIESSNLTQAGTVLGTPSYMSPEQILGLPVDGRSDLFSAGVILYQFLTGERPFTGSATTTMHKVLKEDPLPPSRFNVQVPGAMDAVVRKALAKRPDERFQTAEEFAAALARRGAARGARRPTEPTLIAAGRPRRRRRAADARRPRDAARRPLGAGARRHAAGARRRGAAAGEEIADRRHRDRRRRCASSPSPRASG